MIVWEEILDTNEEVSWRIPSCLSCRKLLAQSEVSKRYVSWPRFEINKQWVSICEEMQWLGARRSRHSKVIWNSVKVMASLHRLIDRLFSGDWEPEMVASWFKAKELAGRVSFGQFYIFEVPVSSCYFMWVPVFSFCTSKVEYPKAPALICFPEPI